VFNNNHETTLKNSLKRDTYETPGMLELKDSFNCTNLNLTNDNSENKCIVFNLQKKINEDSYMLMDTMEQNYEL
jgi:hypothetical protein